MTKKEAIKSVTENWKALNADMPKEKKIQALENLEVFISRLPFESPSEKTLLISCDMVIREFREALERNPNYKDTQSPSSLLYFTLAVNSSTLPD